MTENNRPELNKDLNGELFQQWYWLKDELIQFCRENCIPVSGSKAKLTERITHFLTTGEILHSSHRTKRNCAPSSDITLDTIIEPNFICSEKHRTFFKEQIGKSFTFNVEFQKWLKNNTSKTYADAVAAYYEIKECHEKKSIDKQFEYNTYIRDFFEQNKGLSLTDAIKCWKYKKSQPGHNRYEVSDLTVLNEDEK